MLGETSRSCVRHNGHVALKVQTLKLARDPKNEKGGQPRFWLCSSLAFRTSKFPQLLVASICFPLCLCVSLVVFNKTAGHTLFMGLTLAPTWKCKKALPGESSFRGPRVAQKDAGPGKLAGVAGLVAGSKVRLSP